MPIGLSNTTQSTLQNLTDLANSTSYTDFAGKIAWNVYDGWLYFILLWVVFFLVYIKLQDISDQPLNNLLYSSIVCTILALLLRTMEVVVSGTLRPLLSDYHMWVFPLIVIVLGGAIWMMKDR